MLDVVGTCREMSSSVSALGNKDPKRVSSTKTLPKFDIKCSICGVTDSNFFKKNEKGHFICVDCDDFSFPVKVNADPDNLSDGSSEKNHSSSPSPTEESENNTEASKSKCKKLYVRKTSYNAKYPLAKPVLSKPLKHDGVYFQIGDIVALTDGEIDYYAQIRGLFRDQYCQGYAVITWLLPTMGSLKGKFDPDTYTFGPDEDFPRKLEEMTFVCNAPNEFYKARNGTYPPFSPLRAELGVLLKETGPEIVKLLDDEEYYNPYDKSPRPVNSVSRRILATLPEQKKKKKDVKKSTK